MSSRKSLDGQEKQLKKKSSLQKLFSSASSSTVDQKPKKSSDDHKYDQLDMFEQSNMNQDSQEGKRKKKKRKAANLPSISKPSPWKRVKLSEDIDLKEAGFFMLEELDIGGDINSPEYQMLVRSIPVVPTSLDEEPPVDTNDSDLDSENEEPPSKTKLNEKLNEKSKKNDKKTKKESNREMSNNETNPSSNTKSNIQTKKEATSNQKPKSNEEKRTSEMELDQTENKMDQQSHQLEDVEEQVEGEVEGDVEGDVDHSESEEEVDQSSNRETKRFEFVPQELMEDIDLPQWTAIYPLHKRILIGLKNLGFEEPTTIQKEVFPLALGKRIDIVGASQTGSGKTLSFGIPILHQILELREKNHRLGLERDFSIKALILSPTRELAVQIVDHLKAVSKETDIRISPVIGGISVTKQMRFLRKRPDILVATPGRLWEIISTGLMSEAQQTLANLRFLVFDEADKMVEFGRFSELSNILRTVYDSRQRQYNENMKKQKKEEQTTENNKSSKSDKKASTGPKPLQTFIFSATMSITPEARKNLKKQKSNRPDKIKETKKSNQNEQEANSEQMFEKLMEQIDFQREVDIVDITTVTHQVSNLEEAKIFCLHEEKDYYLYYFLTRYPGKSIIFVNAISNIKRLLPLLVILRIPAFGMHAQMEQHHRLKNLEKFKNTPNAALIATDVMSRGLDIPQVDHVIHYSIPASAEVFVHRSGRTARAFASGISISIVDPEDKRHYTSIMNTLKRDEVPDFPIDMSYFNASKKRVKLAVELDSLSHENAKKTADSAWLKSKASELDADIPDDLLSSDDEISVRKRALDNQRRKIKYNQIKEQLRVLLAQPMLARGSSRTYVTKTKGAQQILTKPLLLSTGKVIPAEEAEKERKEKEQQKIKTQQQQQQAKLRQEGKNKKNQKKANEAEQSEGEMDVDSNQIEEKIHEESSKQNRHASGTAIADLVKIKSSGAGKKSTEILQKIKQKRIRRLASQRPLTGPLHASKTQK